MREDITLKDRYRTILSFSAGIFFLAGLLMILPLATFFGKASSWREAAGFIIPSLFLILLGASLRTIFHLKNPATLTVQEGGIIVLLCWLVICLVSSWPFFHIQGMNFTHSVFEAVSGWTTTGLSVLDLEHTSQSIFFWRSLMQLAGGAGFAIIMLSLMIGPTGAGLSEAEGRGEQLAPHVRHSARIVLEIYAGYALFGVFAYLACGMDLADAINHTFAAISTGGFSSKAESIGFWNSMSVEAVSVVLMVLGSTNFLTAYLIIRGKLRAASRSGELRLSILLIALSSASLFLLVTLGSFSSVGKSVRTAVFETISAITTTGFTTTSYSSWGGFGVLAIIGLMMIGGGTYSTAGGLKLGRVHLLGKSLIWEIRRLLLPKSAVVQNFVWHGEAKEYVSARQITQVSGLTFIYLIFCVVGSLILTANGYGLDDSLFEMTSALSTVGLSVGVTSSAAPPLVLWTEIAGMFLGRLEFLIVFVAIAKLFKDIPAILHKS